MWDNPRFLINIANTLIFCSVCGIIYGGVSYLLNRPGFMPLRSVYLSEAPKRVEAGQVLQVVRNEINGNLFTFDIERLRKALEKLPWVRTVSIRREFPQSLELKLEEHQPLARWNNDALVNVQGEVFIAGKGSEKDKVVGNGRPPVDDSGLGGLPEFIGQDGSAAEVTQRYEQFSQQLAPLDLRLQRLALSPRHAWQLYLNNGMTLELGREDMQRRLAIFVQVYPYSLAALQGKIKYVDLRYRNGFAVGGMTKQG